MTTELEKQFFDTFGIEPKPLFSTRNGYTNDHYIYPTITDTHYLELICLITKELNFFSNYALTSNHLKEYILKEMILQKDNFIKTQIQALFKGE